MKTFFFGDRLKNFCEDLFFFWRALALVSLNLGLGLESVCPRKGCPWPWPRIFFVSLASNLVSSTPPLMHTLTREPLSFSYALGLNPTFCHCMVASCVVEWLACLATIRPHPGSICGWVMNVCCRNCEGYARTLFFLLQNLALGRDHTIRFLPIFWHQSCETSCKSMTHYCGHLSSITLNSPSEKENQTLESLPDFLRRNRTELYFSRKFSKSRRSQRRKLSFQPCL